MIAAWFENISMHLTLARFSIAAAVSMSSRGTKRTSAATMSAATDFIENINVEYERLHKSFEMQFWCAATTERCKFPVVWDAHDRQDVFART